MERFSAEVQVTEARCFYGFQVAIEVFYETANMGGFNLKFIPLHRTFTQKCIVF